MRGGVPEPVESHRREGTFQEDRHAPPVLVSGRPRRGELDEPPEHLDDDARAFWLETVPRLAEAGIIDRVDRPVLEQMAGAGADGRCWSRWPSSGAASRPPNA